ncbi:hypothetical protein M405DRAFT_511449 [Rhizopogon salebrosus TDB-379]|nr:hypothetical protein M405DRAFT_511449 [Rhizopogon salebrosus TDB-379]
MINRLSTAPTNPSATRFLIAHPAVDRLSAANSTTNRTSTAPTTPTPTITTTTAPTTSTSCPAPRPSMDVYDRFLDPAPSGFGRVPMMYAPPPLDPATLRVSRTMQYAHPYAAVRVSLATSTTAPPGDGPSTGYHSLGSEMRPWTRNSIGYKV